MCFAVIRAKRDGGLKGLKYNVGLDIFTQTFFD